MLGCIIIASAQRPSYAGISPKGYPNLAERFKDPNKSETIENRFGDATSTTGRIPVDALGDEKLVNRLNQWPRENRPFWLLNADHIEASRSKDMGPVNVQSRSSFVNNRRNNTLNGRYSNKFQGGKFND